jgi:metallo-beta-lactamase family protein
MLGSAIVALDIADRDTHRAYRLVFSGDLGRVGIPIIRDPEMIEGADFLIMESTYGGRIHEDYSESEHKLEQIITQTYKQGGAVIMPAFAVGRTQHLVVTLHQLVERGDIPHLPIYVDSPLAVDATAVFRLHPECYDDDIRAFITEAGIRDPFGFSDIIYVRSLQESKQLNFQRAPCIIISASGMCEFGRILHHLKNRITDANNTILITGWQAEHTLGRRLVEGAETVRIFGEEYRRHAQVAVLNGFSGHADQSELVAWVGAMKQRPKHTFLVHGEEREAMALKALLHQQLGLTVSVPQTGDTIDLTT